MSTSTNRTTREGAAIVATSPRKLYRGEHELAHMSQVLGRDLDAERVKRNAGGEARAYRMTPEQVEDRRTGRVRGGLPYEFLIFTPESSALSWTAFYTVGALRTWMDAYGITGEIPEPGRQFSLRLPATFEPAR
jgi:hypothetical protein